MYISKAVVSIRRDDFASFLTGRQVHTSRLLVPFLSLPCLFHVPLPWHSSPRLASGWQPSYSHGNCGPFRAAPKFQAVRVALLKPQSSPQDWRRFPSIMSKERRTLC